MDDDDLNNLKLKSRQVVELTQFAMLTNSIRKDMMDMVEDLIKRRSEAFDASKFKNHNAEALRARVWQG